MVSIEKIDKWPTFARWLIGLYIFTYPSKGSRAVVISAAVFPSKDNSENAADLVWNSAHVKLRALANLQKIHLKIQTFLYSIYELGNYLLAANEAFIFAVTLAASSAAAFEAISLALLSIKKKSQNW